MQDLKKLLDLECDYRMEDKTMDEFVSLMSEVRLKNGEALISYGQFDDNVYIVNGSVVLS